MAASSQPLFNTMDSSFQQYADELVDFEAFVNFDADGWDGAVDNLTGSVGDLFPQDQSLSPECSGLQDMQPCGFESFPIEGALMNGPFGGDSPVFSSPQTSQYALDDRIANGYCCQDTHLAPLSPADGVRSESFLQETSAAIRDLVYARATVDSRSASMKEKRRDAAIALHLQRLSEEYVHDMLVSDSQLGYHSPSGDNFHPESVSPRSSQDSLPGLSRTVSSYSPSTPTSALSSEQQASQSPSGGVEMVLDLNMNAATRLPKKQKPRTKAQIESYINVRRNGACEKHRKQHKKCNCLGEIVTSAAKVRKPVGGSRTEHEQSEYIQQSELVSSYGRPAPSMSKVLSPRYVCLMPGCRYSSSTVPSLQRHYARHSVIPSGALHVAGDTVLPQVNAPVDRHLSSRSLPGTTSLVRQEIASSYTRGRLRTSRVAGSPSLSSSPSSGLDYSLESVLEQQPNFLSMVSALVVRQLLLFTIGSLLRFLQFGAAVASCLQAYSSMVATVRSYNHLIMGRIRMVSAEKLLLSS